MPLARHLQHVLRFANGSAAANQAAAHALFSNFRSLRTTQWIPATNAVRSFSTIFGKDNVDMPVDQLLSLNSLRDNPGATKRRKVAYCRCLAFLTDVIDPEARRWIGLCVKNCAHVRNHNLQTQHFSIQIIILSYWRTRNPGGCNFLPKQHFLVHNHFTFFLARGSRSRIWSR